MNSLLVSFLEEADRESRRKRIEKIIGYLNRNWRGIQARRIHKDVLYGCSAKSHMSHVLSARLSSRPMGRSLLGANQMAHLRGYKANDVDLHELYLNKGGIVQKQLSFAPPAKTFNVLPKASGGGYETLDNVPNLRRGATLSLSRLIRRISKGNPTFWKLNKARTPGL
ncbi:MAG: hypothetical protein GX335_08830 [Firmicutes bacterium]|nr:hypothetical protein [Bacillota bacterium]